MTHRDRMLDAGASGVVGITKGLDMPLIFARTTPTAIHSGAPVRRLVASLYMLPLHGAVLRAAWCRVAVAPCWPVPRFVSSRVVPFAVRLHLSKFMIE